MTAGQSPVAGADGVLQRVRLGAYAWVEADGAVLVCRAAPGEPDAGAWAVPGGGVDFGEDPADAVRRELLEETGLTGRIEALAGTGSAVYEPSETRSGHRVHWVGILYRVTVTSGTLRDEADGSTDRAAWVALADLDGLPAAGLLRWARRVVGR